MFINWSCLFLSFFPLHILIGCARILVCEASAAPWTALCVFAHVPSFFAPLGGRFGISGVQRHSLVVGGVVKMKGEWGAKGLFALDYLLSHCLRCWQAWINTPETQVCWCRGRGSTAGHWGQSAGRTLTKNKNKNWFLCVDMSAMSYDWKIICLRRRTHTFGLLEWNYFTF